MKLEVPSENERSTDSEERECEWENEDSCAQREVNLR